MNATPDPTAPPADRRAAARFRPAFGTVCRLAPAAGRPAAVGLVWDLSATGVGMLVAAPPAQGAALAGELTGEDGGPSLPVGLRVAHVRPVGTGDYFLGARFDRPLDPAELRPFVTPPPLPRDE